MPKRKRDGNVVSSGDEDAHEHEGGFGAKQQRVEYKIQQGARKLGHAFKVAKGFERQKLGRRHKSATGDGKDQEVQRINNEIAALKTLDTTSSAQHYLNKTLVKIKSVAESDALPPQVRRAPPVTADPAALNVVARLCNSNPVKDALPAILEEILKALGVEAKVAPAAGKKKRVRAKDFEAAPQDTKVAGGQSNKITETHKDIRQNADSKVREAKQKTVDAIDSVSGSEDEFEGYEDRLASSDEGSESGSLDVDDLERQLEREGVQRDGEGSGYNFAADISVSGESAVSSPEPEPQKFTASKPKTSSFIPSLSMGGYISGSGSDIDDEIDVAPKKNRRGQRARQQIWEKKYGGKAKHLLTPNGAKSGDRNQGWDARKGATDGSARRDKLRNDRSTFGRRNQGAPSATGANTMAAKKHKDDSGPIHPSWQAAKAAKEKQNAPAKFAGKKITFD